MTVRVESALGPVSAPTGAGLGLVGIAHLVAAIDGVFLALPESDRWVVEARLPRRLAGVSA